MLFPRGYWLLAFLLIYLHPCYAQQSDPQSVYILKTMEISLLDDSVSAFIKQMRTRHSDLSFEVENAETDVDKAIALLRQLKSSPAQPDLIVTVATLATRAALITEIDQQIPIVFMILADPIQEGIVTEFGQHSHRNITGRSHIIDEHVKLDTFQTLLGQSHPYLQNKYIALIASTYPSANSAVERLLRVTANRSQDMFTPLRTSFVVGRHQIATMTADIVAQIQSNEHRLSGYWMTSEPLSLAKEAHSAIRNQAGLVQLYADHLESVKSGALFGMFATPESIAADAVASAHYILKGKANASDFPVLRTERYKIAVNLKTAIEQDIVIPSSMLELAGDYVFR